MTTWVEELAYVSVIGRVSILRYLTFVDFPRPDNVVRY